MRIFYINLLLLSITATALAEYQGSLPPRDPTEQRFGVANMLGGTSPRLVQVIRKEEALVPQKKEVLKVSFKPSPIQAVSKPVSKPEPKKITQQAKPAYVPTVPSMGKPALISKEETQAQALFLEKKAASNQRALASQRLLSSIGKGELANGQGFIKVTHVLPPEQRITDLAEAIAVQRQIQIQKKASDMKRFFQPSVSTKEVLAYQNEPALYRHGSKPAADNDKFISGLAEKYSGRHSSGDAGKPSVQTHSSSTSTADSSVAEE
jgi:hypothetical protein